MIRVLVADDHMVVRRGVVQMLEEVGDMVVAGEASRGQEVLKLVQEGEYDVLLLDIGLPDISGIEVLKQVGILCPKLRVLIFSIYPEKQYAVRALKGGAWGYLTKESVAEELITAIRKIAEGERYISGSLGAELAREVGDREFHRALSDREYEILRLLGEGRTVAEIAVQLSLSVKTVSTYRARVLRKLGLESTAEVMRYAFEQGLAE